MNAGKKSRLLTPRFKYSKYGSSGPYAAQAVCRVVGCIMVARSCRYGAGEVHVVAALIGGVLAQEAIKFMTCQFQPLQNTFLYCGVNGTSMHFEL